MVLLVYLIARLFERRMARLRGKYTGYGNLDVLAVRSLRVGNNYMEIFTSLNKSGGS